MDIIKSQSSAAEASQASHDAQLAACQQHLNQLHGEAQAADKVADLVCNKTVTMHTPALYSFSF